MKIKNKIIPAILVKKWSEIEKLSDKFAESKIVKDVQIDICDGKFIENKTWPFFDKEDLSQFLKVGEDFKTGKDFDGLLPNWDVLNFSVDMMCENPIQYLHSLMCYGFSNFTIHFRSVKQDALLLTLGKFEEIEKFCMDFIADFAIAIDLKTDIDEFIVFGKKFKNSPYWNQIQIMGIKEIGKQGEVFDENILEIIKKIKAEFPEKEIIIDGGMSPESIQRCKNAGVNTFVVGSYLSGGNFYDKYKAL